MTIDRFIVDVVIAVVLGAAIGFERQYRQHPAGLRTNALVCLGAALYVLLSRLWIGESSPTRIAAQVVSGIGFLGGGVILREGFTVRGMTTAATLWCSAAVGTLVGGGFKREASIGTVAILVVNFALRPLVRFMETRVMTTPDLESQYRLRAVATTEHEGQVRAIFMRELAAVRGMAPHKLEIQESEQHDKSSIIADIYSSSRNDEFMNNLVSRINAEKCVSTVSWERVQ